MTTHVFGNLSDHVEPFDMPPVYQTIVNCVAILAALLSTLQPLTSTHAYCELTACHPDTSQSTSDSSVNRSCCCSCCHHQSSDAQHPDGHDVVGVACYHPNSPCQCPPNCSCRRPPQPQHPPVFFGDRAEEPAVAAVDCERIDVDIVAASYGPQVICDPCNVSTALDVCAALCRFTT